MDTREVVERYYETVHAGDWDAWLTASQPASQPASQAASPEPSRP